MSPPAGRKASPQFTIAEMLDMEREHLMAMPEAFDGYVEHPSRVSSTCLVSVARLNSPPAPELAQTDLQLKEAPRADTARYDPLRDIEQQEPQTHHAS